MKKIFPYAFLVLSLVALSFSIIHVWSFVSSAYDMMYIIESKEKKLAELASANNNLLNIANARKAGISQENRKRLETVIGNIEVTKLRIRSCEFTLKKLYGKFPIVAIYSFNKLFDDFLFIEESCIRSDNELSAIFDKEQEMSESARKDRFKFVPVPLPKRENFEGPTMYSL